MGLKAVGIHVFAGGFTIGVKQAGWRVDEQLEVHGFGRESAEAVAGVEFVNNERWEDWPRIAADLAFGNPRCTGFSTITSGYGENVHGPWAKQTCDVHEFCKYVVQQDYPIAVWESVQQAYSVGRPLLDYLRDEYFVPHGYRIAHLFINAATFGCVQNRKRYFFVAYKRDVGNFCIQPPIVAKNRPTAYDVLWPRRDRTTRPGVLFTKSAEYDEDTYTHLTKEEAQCVPLLPNGWDLNKLARWNLSLMPEHYRNVFLLRTSDMPFSMHGPCRLNYFTPFYTMHSSAGRFIHPEFNRPVTVGELAVAMGWPAIPVGTNPVAQLAKGIVPAVGAWLARQAELFLSGHWGEDDWESSYSQRDGSWVGRETRGEVEKKFDMTNYRSDTLDEDDYELPDGAQHHYWDWQTKSTRPNDVLIDAKLRKTVAIDT